MPEQTPDETEEQFSNAVAPDEAGAVLPPDCHHQEGASQPLPLLSDQAAVRRCGPALTRSSGMRNGVLRKPTKPCDVERKSQRECNNGESWEG